MSDPPRRGRSADNATPGPSLSANQEGKQKRTSISPVLEVTELQESDHSNAENPRDPVYPSELPFFFAFDYEQIYDVQKWPSYDTTHSLVTLVYKARAAFAASIKTGSEISRDIVENFTMRYFQIYPFNLSGSTKPEGREVPYAYLLAALEGKEIAPEIEQLDSIFGPIFRERSLTKAREVTKKFHNSHFNSENGSRVGSPFSESEEEEHEREDTIGRIGNQRNESLPVNEVSRKASDLFEGKVDYYRDREARNVDEARNRSKSPERGSRDRSSSNHPSNRNVVRRNHQFDDYRSIIPSSSNHPRPITFTEQDGRAAFMHATSAPRSENSQYFSKSFQRSRNLTNYYRSKVGPKYNGTNEEKIMFSDRYHNAKAEFGSSESVYKSIVLNEKIDLEALGDRNIPPPPDSQIINNDGQLIISNSAPIPIYEIKDAWDWKTQFERYMREAVLWYPHRKDEFRIYFKLICDKFNESKDDVSKWIWFDKEWRARVAKVDSNLELHQAMSSAADLQAKAFSFHRNPSSTSSTSFNRNPSSTQETSRKVSNQICNRWNLSLPHPTPCKNLHACLRCRDKSHIVANCTKRPAEPVPVAPVAPVQPVDPNVMVMLPGGRLAG